MRIVFYPAQAGKVWTGDTLEKESLGGSETAVIYIARELAKLGHEVIVFSRGEPGLYDDVLYLPFEEARNFLRMTPIDVLICSRDPLPLIWASHARKRILWFHDLPQMTQYPQADAYVCVGSWQAAHYIQKSQVPQERTLVIGNGVDTQLFTSPATISEKTPEETVAFAWTSNPERGLFNAVEVMQRVRREYPHAELHVFGRNTIYGWQDGHEHVFYPKDMTGVVLHHSMTKAGLAECLGAMDMWLYPTWWPETYCIAALEAMAAGLPVVASAFGALTETCESQVLISGSAREEREAHLEHMTDTVLSLLGNPTWRTELGRKGREVAEHSTWATRALQWDSLIKA